MPRDLAALALAGLVASLATALVVGWVPGSLGTGALLAGAAVLFGAGFVFRAARRLAALQPHLTLHQALSFEILFQGAFLLNPRLPSPDVERAFLARETGLKAHELEPWFAQRTTAAWLVPCGLGALALGLAGAWIALVIVLAAGALSLTLAARKGSDDRPGRFVSTALLGLAAAIGESLALTWVVHAAAPACPTWSVVVLYGALHLAFEFSPVPLTLGVLEGTYGLLALAPGLALPGLAFVGFYRLARVAPALAGALFYLGRYKLTVRDLFDPALARTLAPVDRAPPRPAPDSTDVPRLSVVIPAYNEAERLPRFLPDVTALAEAWPGGAEVVVVDDGSRDGTPDYVNTVARDHPEVRLVRQPANLGKGAAVRRGMLEARGAFVLFADADGATPIEEARKLFEAATRTGADVVIASRKAGGDGHCRRSLARDVLGLVFYRLTNLLAVPGVRDTQCGFKLFSRDAARRIFHRVTETGWAFDVEVLFLAQKLGHPIQEVAVHWTAVEGSKIHPVRDALAMFLAILRIRHRHAGAGENVPAIRTTETRVERGARS